MKRCFTLLLILSLVFSGCARQGTDAGENVVFYYLRADISTDETYGDKDSVIVPELQPSLDYNSQLSYLLALYLNGPSDSRLYSPFPSGLSIQSVTAENDAVSIVTNDMLAQLKGLKLTKACACLAMTCFGLTEAESVTVQASTALLDGQPMIELSRDDLILEDSYSIGGTE